MAPSTVADFAYGAVSQRAEDGGFRRPFLCGRTCRCPARNDPSRQSTVHLRVAESWFESSLFVGFAGHRSARDHVRRARHTYRSVHRLSSLAPSSSEPRAVYWSRL